MQPKSEKSDSSLQELILKKTFETRFVFIRDDTLRKNIAIAFEYILFLVETTNKEDHKKLIRSSLCKDILIYTGTIVEACLAHALHTYIQHGKLRKSDILDLIWKEESSGIIYAFSQKHRIRHITERAIYKDTNNVTNFIDINRACLRGHILSKKEYEIAEEIRTTRNKIHVFALKDIDNSYTKEDLDAFLAKATKIITKIEKKLEKLS